MVDFERNFDTFMLMSKSSTGFHGLLAFLTASARAAGLTDSAWAARAGLRKETLSRLRQREDCDWQTLERLANAVDLVLAACPAALPATTDDGQLPRSLARADEDRLARLLRSGDRDPQHWLLHGPRFFMAGLAVLVAGSPGFERSQMLALAEQLHCGIGEPDVFQQWLQRSPLEPSRFLPILAPGIAHAA
jgi:hypothetical protein